MKNFKFYVRSAFVVLFLHSFVSCQIVNMTSAKMNKLELGMSKEQVTQILGNDYTIAEKRVQDNNEIEVLSYRDFYNKDEFYLFLFKDQKLEKWYRELLPSDKIEVD